MVYGMASVWIGNVIHSSIYKLKKKKRILEKIELDVQKYTSPNLPRNTKKLTAFYQNNEIEKIANFG